MIKLATSLAIVLFSGSIMAATSCPEALPTNNAGFCPSFQAAAQCHCTSSGVPKGLCQDVRAVYKRMLALFGSVQRACEYQKNTSTQTCVDDWGCYINGGIDSQGRQCSGTGAAC